ncbi:MAG: prepilin-type N-terminal cleavage/methylation domain-containing protein [Sulfurimonas sp.]|uniref:pilus assembly FimT family protein n=1 Tax=Sulfurimonas sp. TaxID=2022749 RepID=UPI0025E8E9BE|nr:prepilin-type N-terminal cleavage/methylation domain-containing protein [Sulfurimonas sp.]MCK9491856.1 prepilin-type N-terminal cleavage/methylation domain-containing protein [Sulfurimonas sp.]
MKKAFTMMELIFVLIVIGILAAVIMPEMKSNKLREAAIQLISHIRYTQHLAMVDDKFDATDDNWYKGRWQIVFGTSNFTNDRVAYTVFSDTSGNSTGNPDNKEIAINPMNKFKLLTGGFTGKLHTSDPKATKELNIGETYGITSYSLDKGCSNARIAFDHMGRPFTGDMSSTGTAYHAGRLIQTDAGGDPCEITLTSSEGSIVIAIEPETGYAHIIN